jgi:hypothetical protein
MKIDDQCMAVPPDNQNVGFEPGAFRDSGPSTPLPRVGYVIGV